MKLNAPKFITFIIAVILAVLGVVFHFVLLPAYAIWFVVVGFILLALGNLIKGL